MRTDYFINVVVSVGLLLLAGCSPQYPMPQVPSKLPTQVNGASDANIMLLQARLAQSGVQVISMGQNYLISIPSTLLFASQSPRIQWESYKLLNEVACYLQQFRKVSISVTGYSSRYLCERREKSLTLARAHSVADYLWSQGIDSRFIFTHGSGSDKSIVVGNNQTDASPSSRIEITFRRVLE